jgi:putative membrane protein
MMWGNGWGMGSMWLIVPLMIVVAVLLVLMILIAVRLFSSTGGGVAPTISGPHTKTSARLILDERFARGELTAEEYRERVQLLGEG